MFIWPWIPMRRTIGKKIAGRGFKRALLEALETRILLNGLTVITHGLEPTGTMGPWVNSMGSAIAAWAGAGSAVYLLQLQAATSTTVSVKQFERLSGPPEADSANAENILLLDWASVSGIGEYSSTYIASFVAPFLEQPFPDIGIEAPLAQGSIQLMGHSRGASVVSELAKDLGKSGIWVDQLTLFDPVPVPPDPLVVSVTSNVIFSDNYYQRSGNGLNVPNGKAIDGAFNVGPLLLGGAYNSLAAGGTHSDVHLFYYGTVDTAPGADDGKETVPDDWYPNNDVTRTDTGFLYSRLGGGIRPASGVATAFDGTAPRSSVTRSGAQWPNIGFVNSSLNTITSGQPFSVGFKYQDFDSSATVQWFLDPDTNPYNGNSIPVNAGSSVAKTGSAIASGDDSLVFNGNAGAYHLEGEITDGTATRYAYASDAVTVSNPAKQLVFAQEPPSSTTAGAGFSITVQIHDANGQVITGDNSIITLSLAGTAGGTLGGTISVAAVNGVASFTNLSIITLGTYTLDATASDDTPATSSTITITPDTTSAHLQLVQPADPILVGGTLSPIVFEVQDQFGNVITSDTSTVTLGIASGPGGAVLGGTTTVTPVDGVVTFTAIKPSTAGTYTLSATAAALPVQTPAQFSLDVAQAVTTITRGSMGASFVFGKTISIPTTAKSTVPSVPFTGSVLLLDANNDVLATAPFPATGSPKFSVTGLVAGTYDCTISYPGDANHTAASTTRFTFKVTPATTNTLLQVNSKTLYPGMPLTLTATVDSTGAPFLAHTGTITFKSGSTTLGTVNVVNESASLTIPTPAVGSKSFTAVYSGDPNFKTDNSPAVSVSVKKDTTFAILSSSAVGPVATGQQFTLTCVVSSVMLGGTIPTGTVTFKDGSKKLGTAMLDVTGSATLVIVLSTLGTHSLTASFSGDPLTNTATSAPLLQVVAALT